MRVERWQRMEEMGWMNTKGVKSVIAKWLRTTTGTGVTRRDLYMKTKHQGTVHSRDNPRSHSLLLRFGERLRCHAE